MCLRAILIFYWYCLIIMMIYVQLCILHLNHFAFWYFLSLKGISVSFNVTCYFDLKLYSCSYYDMWWMYMWYIVVICSETIVYSLVRTVFAKVGFCSVLSILRASFRIWWVRKLIWEIRRYIWVIRSRAGLGVRFRGLRFRDLGKRVACEVATCHLGKRAKLFVATN